MKWPRRKRRPETPIPAGVEMVILETGKRYPLVPFFSHVDEEGITCWRVVLHPDVDGDVFVDTERPIGMSVQQLPGRCTLAFGFVRTDDDRVRVMRHAEVKDAE